MALYTLNYADWRYRVVHKSDQDRHIRSAQRVGIPKDNILSWNRKQLVHTAFYKKYKHILDIRLGAGLWLWNPFLIYKTLQGLRAEDTLVYLDCDIPYEQSLKPLIPLCKKNNGLLHFRNKHYNIEYTKRYCFQAMHCDTPEYHQTTQICGGFAMVQKTAFSLAFYKEFLDLCCDVSLVDTALYGVSNYPQFIAHRHPVSVLTNLYVRKKLPAFKIPCDPDLIKIKYPEYNKTFTAYEKKQNAKYCTGYLLGGQLGSFKSKHKLSQIKRGLKQ